MTITGGVVALVLIMIAGTESGLGGFLLLLVVAVLPRAIAHARKRSGRKEGADRAAALFDDLTAGRALKPLDVDGLVMGHAENARLEFRATYSRLYGLEHDQPMGNILLLGWLGLAELIGVYFAASRARKRAEAEAGLRWRDVQVARVVLTNQRLVCRADHQWLSFYYREISALYPDMDRWEVVLEFRDARVAPLRLDGSAVRAICVYLCWALHGRRGLTSDPAFAALRSAGRRAGM
ncbi:hypothetical protein [Pseudonocardia acaciae]|uniref:hypothetical protein n=1 Tax=Pseudonocardia acaciae TaxID=551276 RepID=UPI00048FA145|nr:hypothetical protein [Pseudonocardia acaciae]